MDIQLLYGVGIGLGVSISASIGVIGAIQIKSIFAHKKVEPKKKVEPEKPLSRKETMEIFDKIIDYKFQFYLYKDILPLLIGNSSKTKISKDIFIKLKESFYNDVKYSIGNDFKKQLHYVLSSEGIGFYIHQRFGYLFNKIDSKFVDTNTLEKDLFFMADLKNKEV